jgi:plasmid stability protein
MAVLHVRGVPDELYERVKRRARQEGRSLSAEVVYLLQESVRRPVRSQSEVLASLEARRSQFRPAEAGAASTTELIRLDRSR